MNAGSPKSSETQGVGLKKRAYEGRKDIENPVKREFHCLPKTAAASLWTGVRDIATALLSMCGFGGFYDPSARQNPAAIDSVLRRIGDAVQHRGPNDRGEWHDASAGIGLAHRRLAVIDVSAAGEQPMHAHSGRYVIAYNGEIYNHLTLRAELESSAVRSSWTGHSDTETLLAAIDAWGVPATLARIEGMFAFALWDRQERVLTLARDRIGEKPLYYGWQHGRGERAFLFGSELKALAKHPAFGGEVDREAVGRYVRYGYIPAPRSIYTGIQKLLPGHYLTLSSNGQETISPYWSLTTVVSDGLAAPIQSDEKIIIDGLEDVLGRAVSKQMISDVPLGAFLSGGIDSSTIVALMQANSSRPVKTFTIGFDESGFDEAKHAKAVAQHLRTDHTEMYVSPDDALSVIPLMPKVFDEPFADSSQIPTFLLAQLARQHVTVALSGDGGDELFGGYERYHLSQSLWSKTGRLPAVVRGLASSTLRAVPRGVWNGIGSMANLSLRNGRKSLGDVVLRGADLLAANSAAEVNDNFASRWSSRDRLVPSGYGSLLADTPLDYTRGNIIHSMMEGDLKTFLPDDILVKVDRAAMAVSLETRCPYLDHEVIEYVWKLPASAKWNGGQTKIALRNLLYRHVPRHLIDRPKAGFVVPINSWLRGPLRDWAEGLINERDLEAQGFFNPRAVTRAWNLHSSGKANLQAQLWTVLMFQAWLRDEQKG